MADRFDFTNALSNGDLDYEGNWDKTVIAGGSSSTPSSANDDIAFIDRAVLGSSLLHNSMSSLDLTLIGNVQGDPDNNYLQCTGTLTIQGGTVTLIDLTIDLNGTGNIVVEATSLTLTRCTILGLTTPVGSGGGASAAQIVTAIKAIPDTDITVDGTYMKERKDAEVATLTAVGGVPAGVWTNATGIAVANAVAAMQASLATLAANVTPMLVGSDGRAEVNATRVNSLPIETTTTAGGDATSANQAKILTVLQSHKK